MPTGYEVDAYRDLSSIAKSLKAMAATLIEIKDRLPEREMSEEELTRRYRQRLEGANGQERKKPTA